jgi:hypothetical protein
MVEVVIARFSHWLPQFVAVWGKSIDEGYAAASIEAAT